MTPRSARKNSARAQSAYRSSKTRWILSAPNQKVLDWRIETIDEASSTNDLVSARARQGEASGLVVRAISQTKGRGRQGRSWFSPPGGGLYFSALLRPDGETEISSLLTLILGVAAAEGLREVTGLRIGLKWPNDLRVEGRKIGGNPVRIYQPPESTPRRRRRLRRQPHEAAGRFSPRTARNSILGSSLGRAGS